MLLGSFGELDRPYFFCTVYLARLGVSGSVRFMLDTGADTTMLGNADAKRLGIGSERLGPSRLLHGLGGSAIVHDERASLVFSGDNGTQYAHDIDLAILDPEGDPIPSLLGRNVFANWRLEYSQLARRLAAEVVRCDRSSTALHWE